MNNSIKGFVMSSKSEGNQKVFNFSYSNLALMVGGQVLLIVLLLKEKKANKKYTRIPHKWIGVFLYFLLKMVVNQSFLIRNRSTDVLSWAFIFYQVTQVRQTDNFNINACALSWIFILNFVWLYSIRLRVVVNFLF